ncbi:replication factor A [Halocatena pleomorpha]|uniref:Replication factor A n=1 Tax=Halocatena pleomorpha TaxID=1785090 RepID=A0A3P3RDY8_9EURY|nr:replication factor A [Halocatena pleomorpha]RRJ31149.1 replication factor A [Halocatena pleomorpha]
MTELRQLAESVHAQFSDHLDVDVDEIEERLETLVSEYKVPPEEARRSLVSNYLSETEMDREQLSDGSNDLTPVAEIDTDEEWIDVRAKVVELWEPRNDAIAQVGLLGDESGRIKFVSFATSDLPLLEEEAVYQLGNVVTDEYNGRFSVKLNRTTSIEQLDTEIEVGDDTTEIEGALVDIQRGSGLIKRCPQEDCTRVLQNGRCSEHGEVDGEFDLRIKGVLDDGSTVQELVFDREATEELTGITLDRAKDMAMDALDTSVVTDEMKTTTLGQYYRVRGPMLGRYLLVNEFERLGAMDTNQALTKARSI